MLCHLPSENLLVKSTIFTMVCEIVPVFPMAASALSSYSTPSWPCSLIKFQRFQACSHIQGLCYCDSVCLGCFSNSNVYVSLLSSLKSCFRCLLLSGDSPDHSPSLSTPFPCFTFLQYLALANMIFYLYFLFPFTLMKVMLNAIRDKSDCFNSIVQ